MTRFLLFWPVGTKSATQRFEAEWSVFSYRGKKMNKFKGFLNDEGGPTAVEYAVMLALIAGACFAAITLVGISTGGFWSESADELQQKLGT